jgi:GT2 family glycosyltransferase
MKPLVYVIVLNWNAWEDTIECLSSLQKLDYPNYVTVVVDNGSTDGSEDRIREARPSITILQTGENLGFTGGNNVGIRYALERGAEYVWLLNNDTVVDPKALGSLVEEALSDTRIGIVGSKIYYYEPPDMIWFAGGILNPLTGRNAHRGEGERDVGQYDSARDVDYIVGCSLLARKEMVNRIGLLDPNFFIYFEDLDWATRAKRDGWRVRYQPESKVWHKESQAFGGARSPGFRFHFSRGSILYARKHRSPTLIALLLQVALRQVLSSLLRRNFAAARASIRGAKRGLTEARQK